jgi:HD superfamily phosphodiesterase
MNLIPIIESAELRFKQVLEEFFISIYDERSLSSHGIDHHRRVWEYSKELVLLMDKFNLIKDSSLPFRLIMACYLHDIGMSVDRGIKHGHHSRDLGIRFMKENHLDMSEYQDVLPAIENHDNKDYKRSEEKSELLTILSVADDLDAFGFIGIYRYIEIYTARGIKPVELGYLIRDNARNRFNNFTKSFAFSDDLIMKHKTRFEILDNFFMEYNKQVPIYKFGGDSHSGCCGVVEMLIIMINKKMNSKDYYTETESQTNDSIIQWFFNDLASELKS